MSNQYFQYYFINFISVIFFRYFHLTIHIVYTYITITVCESFSMIFKDIFRFANVIKDIQTIKKKIVIILRVA